MNSLNEVLTYIHPAIGEAVRSLPFKENITEIRLNCMRSPLVCTEKKVSILHGDFCDESYFRYSVNAITGGNLYSVGDKMKSGFITLPGGHRVGLCAGAVTNDTQVCNVKDISSLCFRVAKEIKGTGRSIACEMISASLPVAVLIASPPGYGKTTILRDICANLSGGSLDGIIRKVGVCDERSEIAAMCNGVPAFDIGPGAFVYDGYPKSSAIMMMLRTMCPDVIITDEIGTDDDFMAICTASRCGVSVVASVHGGDTADLRTRLGKNLINFDAVYFIGDKRPGYKVYRRDKGDY